MEKILVADDDAEIQDIVRTILTREGYEVVSARDGKEAIELAKTTMPDLVILDYLMPFLNGVEVCKKLKEDDLTKSIPIVMITAYPQEKENGLSAGAMDFFTKPIEKVDLLLRVKSILKVRHISNELQKIIGYMEELGK
ncbi:MAG: response regulator [Candidatus Omnitrophica bacterium]|nr:response regulator [Candidatus Omnitrophota bacterium]